MDLNTIQAYIHEKGFFIDNLLLVFSRVVVIVKDYFVS